MKYTKLIALLLSISLLASCGSGSYGNDSTQPSAVSSGEDVSTQETKAEGTAVPASSRHRRSRQRHVHQPGL